MGRGLIILLIASLGLNIFGVGFYSGRVLAGGKNHHPRVEVGERSRFEDPFKLMRYAEELSPELRDSFRSEFREKLPALREEHRRMRTLRGELGELMSADPWDGDAVSAKLEEIRTAQGRQHDVFNGAFVNAFETLPASERKRLIDAASERRKADHRRHKERKGDKRKDGNKDGAPPPEQ